MRRLPEAIALAGLLTFAAALCLFPMGETDLFFRLAVGQRMLATGALPRVNLFSFTYPAHPDLDSAWLFDVAAAALHSAGGFPALVLGKTAVVLVVFVGTWALARRLGAGPVAAAVGLALAAVCIDERLVERPHLFSFAGEIALLAATTARVCSHGRRRLWLVVPMTALWANLHAGAFIAPVLLALVGVGQLIERRHAPATLQASAQPWMQTFAIAGASALALLATPVGTGIFSYLASHVGLFAIHPVDEFRPPSWRSDTPLVLYAAAALIALFGDRRRPRPWSQILPLLGLLALAAHSVRFAADFALAAAPFVAARVTALAQAPIALARALAGRASGLAVATGAVLVAVALGPRVAAVREGRAFVDIDLDVQALPLDAIRFADANGLRERMYNDFEIGAYLLWQSGGRHRVFVDPRLPAYPRDFHRLLGRAHLPRPEWDAALERHGVTSALLGHAGINHRIGWWDPDRWALVYRQQDSRVFVRRLPRFAALIASHEIPATFAFTPETGATTVPLAEPPTGSPVPGCEWQRRLGDLYFDLDAGALDRAWPAYRRALAAGPGCLSPASEAATAAWVGSVELARGGSAAALLALDRALAINPDDLAMLTNRALALEATHRPADARAVWKRIAELGPGTPLGARARLREATLAAQSR